MTEMLESLPACWQSLLADEFRQPYFHQLSEFLKQERCSGQIFPPEDQVFRALQLTPFREVRVVIVGQDPYHDAGQAHGLSFSVKPGIPIPPSLKNIFRELHSDLGISPAPHGCLEAWARQGVLLLNTVLTVRAHEAHSHRRRGWENFTAQILRHVNELPGVVFILWGGPAQENQSRIAPRHGLITSAHPSPLSARRGFFASRPFSRANALLRAFGSSPIDWQLPDYGQGKIG